MSTTPLTREEAAAILIEFLDIEKETDIVHTRTYQGPGYAIELYENHEIAINWGEDDEEFGVTAYHVQRKGEPEGHGFTSAQAEALLHPERVVTSPEVRAQRHEIMNDFECAMGHLADWQEHHESGPQDDYAEWEEELKDIMEASRLLRKLRDRLGNLR